jgi:hypothetical protein
MIDFERQVKRKFVFENSNPVNEKRFTLLNLPQVHTKNKRPVGFIDFNKVSPRQDLFP